MGSGGTNWVCVLCDGTGGVTQEQMNALLLCFDCLHKHGSYMVRDDLWRRATRGRGGTKIMLCVNCLVKRIGRDLTANDFLDKPINDVIRYAFRMRTQSEAVTRLLPRSVSVRVNNDVDARDVESVAKVFDSDEEW